MSYKSNDFLHEEVTALREKLVDLIEENNSLKKLNGGLLAYRNQLEYKIRKLQEENDIYRKELTTTRAYDMGYDK